MEFDLIICGAGAGGLSAAIYACRAGLRTLVLEKLFSGGQVASTYEVENYPGIAEAAEGTELAMRFETQARKFGAELRHEEILSLSLDGEMKEVQTTKERYCAPQIILAMGAQPKMLGLEREESLRGRGVSYCAACDGAFYRNKSVAVVGGGNTALEDALFLSKFCERVYLIHRRDVFRGDKYLADKVLSDTKITVLWDTVAETINGDPVQSLSVRNVKTGITHEIEVSGLFVAVGITPQSFLAEKKVAMEDGYILTDEMMRTNVKGVYAVGDVRKKFLRQIVTAASDGAIAASAAQAEAAGIL